MKLEYNEVTSPLLKLALNNLLNDFSELYLAHKHKINEEHYSSLAFDIMTLAYMLDCVVNETDFMPQNMEKNELSQLINARQELTRHLTEMQYGTPEEFGVN